MNDTQFIPMAAFEVMAEIWAYNGCEDAIFSLPMSWWGGKDDYFDKYVRDVQ